jgi:hypothetical protein
MANQAISPLITVGILIVFICLTIPITAADIIFSDPIIVDSSHDAYFPAGSILETTEVLSGIEACEGPVYDLVMVGNGIHGGCILLRIDHNGNLLDTASLYVRQIDIHGNDSSIYRYKASMWVEPYYYIITAFENRVYYTRIDENLNLIDAAPVDYIYSPRRLTSDGEHIWAIYRTDDNRYIANRFHLPDPNPEFIDIELPDYIADADIMKAANGLYACEFIHGDTLIYPAYISPTGELNIYDPVRNEPIAPYVPYDDKWIGSVDSDDAYCCWFEEPDSGSYVLRFFSIRSSDGRSSREIYTFQLDSFSHDLDLDFIACRDVAGTLVAICKYDAYTAFIRFDPITATLINADTIPGASIYNSYLTDYYHFIPHDSLGILISINWNGRKDVRLGIIDLNDPLLPLESRPILYHSVFFTCPTLLIDSTSMVLYFQRSDTDSVIILGNQYSFTSFPQSISTDKIIPIDGIHTAPWLYDLGDRRALFWHQYDGQYHVRFVTFNGTFPTVTDIDNLVELGGANRKHPPVVLRIDSLLYIAQFRGWSYQAYELELYSTIWIIDLVSDETTEIFRPVNSSGRYSFIPVGDTAVTVEFRQFCIDHGLTYCREYYCGYNGVALCGNSIIDYGLEYQESHGLCGYVGDTYGDRYFDVFAVPFDNDYLLSFEDKFELKKLNYSGRYFEDVIDLRAATGIDFGYNGPHPYSIHTVLTDDAIAVFMVNSRHEWKSHLLVFDREWNFRGHAIMPILGSPYDYSQFEYAPGEDKIYYAYSSYLSRPYASPRVILQSVSIDNVTAADEQHIRPKVFQVWQNSPNPFNASTKITFYLPTRSRVTVSIYNILGKKVITLIDQNAQAGRHEVSWNGTDNRGKTVATGIYLYRISTGGNEITKKMLLLK